MSPHHQVLIGTDMLTDFVSGFLARRALSKREQKQNNVLLFWDKAQRAKKVVNISLPIDSHQDYQLFLLDYLGEIELNLKKISLFKVGNTYSSFHVRKYIHFFLSLK